jgi:hypothetical protein
MTVTLIGSKGLIGSALKFKLNDLNQMTNCLDFDWGKADLYLEDKIDLSNFMLKFQNSKILQMLSNSKHIIISLGIVHVSSTQSQVDIRSAIVTTLGAEAIDTLYVTEISGGALSDERAREVRERLAAMLK